MSLRRSLPLIAAGVAIWTIAASVDGDAMAPGLWIVFAAAALSALAVFLEPGDDRGLGRYGRPPPQWPRRLRPVPADCPAPGGRPARRFAWVPPRFPNCNLPGQTLSHVIRIAA